jgi:hypothetical protein
MVVAVGAVLIGVIVVALGRGGELAYFQADYAPLKLDLVSATDVALFRPPVALWGYNAQATDEALGRIASAITERDIEITALRQQVADLEALTTRRRAYGNREAAGRSPGPRGPESSAGWDAFAKQAQALGTQEDRSGAGQGAQTPPVRSSGIGPGSAQPPAAPRAQPPAVQPPAAPRAQPPAVQPPAAPRAQPPAVQPPAAPREEIPAAPAAPAEQARPYEPRQPRDEEEDGW